MLDQFLEAGKIVGTHGLQGELRVDPWCDSAAFLDKFKTLYWNKGAEKLEVISSRIHKTQLLLRLKGVNSIEQGDVLRGKIIYINRADVNLEKGRYFLQDLIGLEVFDADTCVYYGKLTEVMRTGANDVYQITAENKKDYLIPAIRDVIIDIDITNGKMHIRPMKGIFDDAD